MGNYMDTCIQRKPATEDKILQQQEQQEEKQDSSKISGTHNKESGRVRVKLVLTKGELEWLLVQMQKDQGKKLEQVLEEIEKSRLIGESVTKWKPCLETIMETPEVHHHMDRLLS